MTKKRIVCYLTLLILVIAAGLIVISLWYSGYRPFMDCSNKPANPFPQGEKYKGFEAAKDLDYCGGYNKDFKIGCEEYMNQMSLYLKNCLEK